MLSKIKDITIKNFCEKLNRGEITSTNLLNEIRESKLDFFWHPLGFVLGTYLSHDKEKIRIHIWPKEGSQQQKPYWNIHNHVFHLTSWVLEGEITNQEYRIINDQKPDKCIYKVSYQGSESCLLKTKQEISIVQEKKEINCKGGVYRIGTNIFHHSMRTSVNSALTIVLSIKEELNSPLVIGDIHAKQEYRYSRVAVDSNYLNNLINEFN